MNIISFSEVNAGLCYLAGGAVALKSCHSFGAEYGFTHKSKLKHERQNLGVNLEALFHCLHTKRKTHLICKTITVA